MIAYAKPRERKGHVVTAIEWHSDGSIKSATYERVARGAPVQQLHHSEPSKPRRGVAAEQPLLC